jgi:hypothetical protein
MFGIVNEQYTLPENELFCSTCEGEEKNCRCTREEFIKRNKGIQVS